MRERFEIVFDLQGCLWVLFEPVIIDMVMIVVKNLGIWLMWSIYVPWGTTIEARVSVYILDNMQEISKYSVININFYIYILWGYHWVYYRFNGIGTLMCQDGRHYKGQWKDGKKHGEVCIINALCSIIA